MIKKTITYKNLLGEDITEDFYFNVSKFELLEMEASKRYGFANYLEAIIKSNDRREILANFKEIILMAYGEKAEDGKRFIKSPELSTAFSQTGAFDELMMELATDEKAAAAFVNGVVPQDMDIESIREGRAQPQDHKKAQ